MAETSTTDTATGPGEPPARPRRVIASWLTSTFDAAWPPVATLVVLLAIWEVAARVSGVRELILPTPTVVGVTLVEDAPQLLAATGVTVQEILIGLVVSIVVGILLAVLIVSFKFLERALYPLLVALQVIPKVALAPLFLIWFGFDLTPKIVMVFLLSFFPIVINTAIGLRGMEVEKLYLARSMGAGPLTTLFRFRIPQALPSIFGGVKIATTVSVIGAVVAEFVGGNAGLGYLITQANARLDAPLMFASIVYLTIVGMLLFLFVDIVERFVMPWHVSRREKFNTPK